MAADTKTSATEEYVAIIRIRGEVGVRGDIKDTLRMLGVSHKHNMSVHKVSPPIMGMIRKAQGYITFGTVSKEIADEFGLKQTVKMHPPRGGYERKGIKVPFKVGGALGNRGDKMSVLIDKMRIN